MSESVITIKDLLDIIFKTVKKNANYFADVYLLKDVSMVYKWRCNKFAPKSEDILQIVKFTINESSEAQRRIIRDKIEQYIINSTLNDEIKYTILNNDSFEDFLNEALIVSTSEYKEGHVSNESIEPFSMTMDLKDLKKVKNNSGMNENSSSDEIDGEYSGVMKFDLVLNKKGDGKEQNLNIKGIEIKDLNHNKESKSGLFGDYKRKITITSIVLIGTLLNFLILYALSGNPGSKPQNTSKIVGAYKNADSVESTPDSNINSETPAATSAQKVAVKVENTAEPTPKPENTMQKNTPVKTAEKNPYTGKAPDKNQPNTGSYSTSKNQAGGNNVISYNNISGGTITTNITNIAGESPKKDDKENNEESLSPDNILVFNYLRTLEAEEVGADSVKLTWSKLYKQSDYKKIKIYRKNGGSSSNSGLKLIGALTVDSVSFTDTGLSPSSRYTYKVLVESASDELPPLLSYDLEVNTASY